MELEYQSFDFELKALGDSNPDFFTFEGYASTFGNVDKVGDIIERGAFSESIEKTTPTILFMHDPMQPVGMPTELREDEAGLFVKGNLPKTDALVRDRIIPQMKVGSIGTMSIGFRIPEGGQRTGENGLRYISKADLKEFSLVTTNFEANDQAQITAFKALRQPLEVDKLKSMTKRDLERALRDSGFCSKNAAALIASDFRGDSGDEDAAKALNSLSQKLAVASISMKTPHCKE